MQHLINDVRAALEADLWYGALGIALALPEIGANLENASGGSGEKYRTWFDANVGDRHRYLRSDQTQLQMRGADAWKLRCAYLHAGELELTPDPTGARAHHRFRFVHGAPGYGAMLRQEMDDEMMVEVDAFCEDMCVMAERWIDRTSGQEAVLTNIDAMPMIFEIQPGVLEHGRWDVGLARRYHPRSLLPRRRE